jgi:hypothetical protein
VFLSRRQTRIGAEVAEKSAVQSSLRSDLQQISGVDDVALDEELRRVWLLLRSDADPERAAEAARALISDADYTVLTAFRPDQRDRQRVRLVELRRVAGPGKSVGFSVTLEWEGRECVGEAMGETGQQPVELRTVAAATLHAIECIIPADLKVKLSGVKQVRAFDADLVVVSMYRPDASPHNVVGAVVTGDDPVRATAAAVLSGLNRHLGNYLARS